MRKHNRKNQFTLVELLVSLGVFSVLLVVFMQIFSGMRLIWTNSEKEADVSSGARVAMDVLSELVSAAYSSSAAEDGKFLFRADQTPGRPGMLYFACKTNYDLPGTNPIRFIGVQVPNTTKNFGAGADSYYTLYLTVLSNDDSENVKAANGQVYHRFSPDFLKDDDKDTISASEALTKLCANLDGKVKTSDTDNSHRIELLRNVTDFQVRAYKADGAAYTGNTVDEAPDSLEISISVLTDADFARWAELKGGVKVVPDNAEKLKAARKFRLERQKTFTRRIRIDSHNQLVENEI